MATIKVPREVRDHVRDAARAAKVTQGQLIEQLLEQRRKADFWEQLEAETADQEYREELAKADRALLPDAEDAIARFESA